MIQSLRSATLIAAAGAILLLATTAVAVEVPAGSCDCEEETSITNLQQCVNIFLDPEIIGLCEPCDVDGDAEVGISELQGVVNCFLDPTAENCPKVMCGEVPLRCGDGVITAPEECDDGGSCFSGSRLGLECTTAEECPGGVPDTCRPSGGDGCAANCTTETVTTFVFTGAKCFGGAKNNQTCKFESFCAGGSKPGRPCSAAADCPGGACVSECGADSRGCFGDGECSNNLSILCPTSPTGMAQNACASGASAGLPCSSTTDCGGAPCTNPCTGGSCVNRSRAALVSVSVPLPIGPLIGQQTSHYGKPSPDTGIIPIANPVSGTSFNPVRVPALACACVRGGADPASHGPGNSGSGLINCGAGTIENEISIGGDHSTLPARRCFGGANDGMVCTPRCTATSTTPGVACRVVGTNPTECPGANTGQRQCQQNFDCPGGTCTITNGPGVCSANSQNAGRACYDNTTCLGTGARCEGRCTAGANLGAACSCDTAVAACAPSTCGTGGICTVTGVLGGGTCMGPPKFCSGGPTPDKACFHNSECGSGGTCQGSTAGSTATSRFLAWCDSHDDCPGSLCNSIDDAGCNDVDPAPPEGSGDVACLESKTVCTAGSNIGNPCTNNNQCPGALNACGNTCNATSIHPNVCNSATHITVTGAGGIGSALLLSTTAIGTITSELMNGTCAYAAQCAGGTANGQVCAIDLDCPGGACASAICNGFCSGTSPANAPCLTNANCTGNGICTPGSAFNTKCTVDGPCGTGGICRPVEVAKGLDGLPCTDDDAQAAKGVPQTIPQTTGRSITTIIDANVTPGSQLVHKACFPVPAMPDQCTTSVVGTPFDCAQITQPVPDVSGVRLANTFPTVDGQTGDGAVSTFLTAR